MPCVGRHVLVAGFQIPSAQRQVPVQVGGQRLYRALSSAAPSPRRGRRRSPPVVDVHGYASKAIATCGSVNISGSSCAASVGICRWEAISPDKIAFSIHTLAFSTGKSGRRLSQFYIPKSDILQDFNLIQDLRHIFKEFHSTVDRHVKYIGN